MPSHGRGPAQDRRNGGSVFLTRWNPVAQRPGTSRARWRQAWPCRRRTWGFPRSAPTSTPAKNPSATSSAASRPIVTRLVCRGARHSATRSASSSGSARCLPLAGAATGNTSVGASSTSIGGGRLGRDASPPTPPRGWLTQGRVRRKSGAAVRLLPADGGRAASGAVAKGSRSGRTAGDGARLAGWRPDLGRVTPEGQLGDPADDEPAGGGSGPRRPGDRSSAPGDSAIGDSATAVGARRSRRRLGDGALGGGDRRQFDRRRPDWSPAALRRADRSHANRRVAAASGSASGASPRRGSRGWRDTLLVDARVGGGQIAAA